jgi:hypothetical protein
METMEGLSERLEALENRIRAVKRRLHYWRAHCSATLLLAALVVYALVSARPVP